MKFLFDHDVPDDLSYLLQELGHEVSLLRHLFPKDASDPSVFQFAYDNDFLLVTCNRDDFLELAKQSVSRDHHRRPSQNTCRGADGVIPFVGTRWRKWSEEQHQLCVIGNF